MLYDSLKDPNIRKAYANLRAKTEKQKIQTETREHTIPRSHSTNTVSSTMRVPASPVSSPKIPSSPAKNNSSTQQSNQKSKTRQRINNIGVNDINLLGIQFFFTLQSKFQNNRRNDIWSHTNANQRTEHKSALFTPI